MTFSNLVTLTVLLTFAVVVGGAFSISGEIVLLLAGFLVLYLLFAYLVVFGLMIPEYIVYRRLSMRLHTREKEAAVRQTLVNLYETLAKRMNAQLAEQEAFGSAPPASYELTT